MDELVGLASKTTPTHPERLLRWLSLFSGAWSLASISPLLGQLEDGLRIGLQKQLLVDDHVIDSHTNLRRTLGRVVKARDGSPLLIPDRPWEEPEAFGYYGSVLHDQGRFRMWYRADIREGSRMLAYAESVDGLDWIKPKLGIVEFEGSKDNNLLARYLGYSFTCFRDARETDPAHRYKACYGHDRKARAALAHSRDGIHWIPYNSGEPVVARAADTYNQVLWDEAAGLYRLYTRTDYGENWEVRGNRSETNPDLKANPTGWTRGRSWKFDREGDQECRRRQVYSLTSTIYEGVHFAFMQVYEWPEDMSEGPIDLHRRHERDVINSYLATSRDGESWDLGWIYAGDPIVPRGPAGAFDKDLIFTMSQFLTHEGRHWIYYTGINERHWIRGRQAAIGLAHLRLDGFVALEAGEKTGVLTTKPFRLEGTGLRVNLDARSGECRVEGLDQDGKTISGFGLSDAVVNRNLDDTDLRISWKQHDLASIRGQTIRLRFHLRSARLYAFRLTS